MAISAGIFTMRLGSVACAAAGYGRRSITATPPKILTGTEQLEDHVLPRAGMANDPHVSRLDEAQPESRVTLVEQIFPGATGFFPGGGGQGLELAFGETCKNRAGPQEPRHF
jgi:hypothetical protein